MKYIVILGDGMADYPVPELDNKTPLQYAKKPNIDMLAKKGTVGMVKTIPEGIAPGSDAANLSVMGYNPEVYYTGRSPLEAVSMGIKLSAADVALRCNLVYLSEEEEEYSDKTMIDYSSDEISTDEARILIAAVNKVLKKEDITFHAGISYRHCMVWNNGKTGLGCTPPHDILEKKITGYLPKEESGLLLSMMKKSYDILKNHPVNLSRKERGLRPANSIWLWGEGKKPALSSFPEKYGKTGAMISAVDLLKGIGICAGLESINVEGATGNVDTNFIGKANAAIDAINKGKDFVYVHVEAPDESGHRYEIDNKVKSIELIDSQVVGPIWEAMKKYDDYKILVLPDHPTPLSLRTHTSEPVPFIIYDSAKEIASPASSYDEFEAKKTNIFVDNGYKLMDLFIKGALD
ncbi:2,3-bisphosphoglycerate-independent phosphoglycerate mutase [Ruminiclostridium sufflavum DSM 19573]|uniref:2,3-bisphosphoglycerate-independent phosphoglycerate mutase n=1 Tax=Ruminiclostridium sufflavum DSM 19573 TaxID=1121337 RepID=A0A318XQI1_9FIRM|nr:cofactor-independent phosphoglycerate mutase [Ruminiclostridium sufflavum]PYG89708.1 2,3-bisphosphoglycerate-independent phosphoglycerate mutase [Ruminiclostridium sufflavum DSM 19573]